MAPVKDRVKKHREKLKSNPEKWEEYKKKERERDKLRRLKQKENFKSNPEVKQENNCYMYRVQCMTKSGSNWKWPVPPDEMLYTRNEIRKKIDNESVIPVSSRGVFKVSDPVLEAAWSKFD